jgi:hypothetical protein
MESGIEARSASAGFGLAIGERKTCHDDAALRPRSDTLMTTTAIDSGLSRKETRPGEMMHRPVVGFP